MWCSKVLVAYDGSSPSERALSLARSIAQQDQAVELVFIHVIKLYSTGSAEVILDKVMVNEAAAIQAKLQAAADLVPNNAHVHVLKGNSPAELIIKSAREENCDLIIMGSRGQGGVKGYLGSVSYSVVQQSPITVLIAKDAIRKEGRSD